MSEVEITLLSDLVSIPSFSGDESRAARYLVRWFRRRGLRAYLDEVGNACAEWGRGDRTILLLGHIDTVSGQIEVVIEGDTLSGRGSVDAKGPLCAFASALGRVAEESMEPDDFRVLLVGAVEEEADTSRGARHLLRRLAGDNPPEVVIIGEPSRWEKVTLGYRGVLRGHSLHGTSVSHTGGPEPTAAELAFSGWRDLLDAVEELNRGERHGLFWRISPRLLSVGSSSDGLGEIARLDFGIRIPPGRTVTEVRELVREYLGSDVAFNGGEEPYLASKNSVIVRGLLRGIRKCGGKPGFTVKTGTSDMNIVGPAWNPAVAAYGPGDPLLGHTPKERISLSEYLKAVDVLEETLIHLLAMG
ncbi:MAG: M20/M25/M40 family metallo-hydrolase [Bacillota bacterium]